MHILSKYLSYIIICSKNNYKHFVNPFENNIFAYEKEGEAGFTASFFVRYTLI